jgi:hypothetical protein
MTGKSTVTTDHEAREDRDVHEGHTAVPFAILVSFASSRVNPWTVTSES